MFRNNRRAAEQFIKEEKESGNEKTAESLRKLAKLSKEMAKKREKERE